MKITLGAMAAGTVPLSDLRTAVRPYGNVDMIDVPRDQVRFVTAALGVLLTPREDTPASVLDAVLHDYVTMLPFETAHGAVLESVTRAWVMKTVGDGSNRPFQYMTFVYDDGVRVTEWVDHGDHGLTLVLDAQGRPAFFSVMTSDTFFDASMAMKDAGMTFGIVDRLEEIPEENLKDLVGAVDPAFLTALPRAGRDGAGGPLARPAPEPAPEPAKPEGLSLRQLYAPPPSPMGRARLGRR